MGVQILMNEDGLRVWEFFAGIGGMRLGLPKEKEYSSIKAVEVSRVVNEAYQHNFPTDVVYSKLVEHFSRRELDGTGDVWLLSPPCQPYTKTKNAKQQHQEDLRSNGFHHLTTVLGSLENPPR